MSQFCLPPLGWRPDLPDHRDFRFNPKALPAFKTDTVLGAGNLPAKVSNRAFCGTVLDQLQLGSCTAHAGVDMYRFFEKKKFGKFQDHSRLFLYKVTRALMGLTGDSGADLRSTMKALALFGTPLEKYWPYTDDPKKFDKEPGAFHYALSQSFQALKYARVDAVGLTPAGVLAAVKQTLAGGWAAMFGFTVYDSISDAADIPVPGPTNTVAGGHAVLAVGYDDNRKIGKSTGALEIQNSWGLSVGDHGFYYLPYWYVLNGQADDLWTMTDGEWFDAAQFE